jgi:hypothetical protein
VTPRAAASALVFSVYTAAVLAVLRWSKTSHLDGEPVLARVYGP